MREIAKSTPSFRAPNIEDEEAKSEEMSSPLYQGGILYDELSAFNRAGIHYDLQNLHGLSFLIKDGMFQSSADLADKWVQYTKKCKTSVNLRKESVSALT